LGTALALPKEADVKAALAMKPYDGSNWDQASAGFRDGLEGWNPYGLHNQIHVWVGGDMLPGTSPNDPVFFLNHCNVDRIWEAWMQPAPKGNGRVYLPPNSAPTTLKGHRLNDDLLAFISPPTKPSTVLNMTANYTYDSLPM
jgi:tyrosinase